MVPVLKMGGIITPTCQAQVVNHHNSITSYILLIQLGVIQVNLSYISIQNVWVWSTV